MQYNQFLRDQQKYEFSLFAVHILASTKSNKLLVNVFVRSYFTLVIVGFFNSVITCISERVLSHLEGMCSDCK